jgi:regulation of enolase protein 1 (concanavalin A-like superfamily)
VCHARRRDNLALAIQMAVEAAFWFYPLVWWMGARLIEEQERACDEDVLRLGCKPQVYAESILRVCQFYLELPPVCVAGVTGSNLKRRMERIMNHRVPKQLGLGKKILIGGVGTALLVVLLAASIPFRDDFASKLEPGWQWIDPQGDSTMSLDARPGFLRITVTGRHDLWPANREYSAPRLMRGVQGDFTVETKIDGPERWCGGLLIWKDTNNFVRFERGIHFRNELLFEGANNGEFLSVARDYVVGDPTWLRLERRGSMVTASYSIDGAEWLPLKRLWRLFAFKGSYPKSVMRVEGL